LLTRYVRFNTQPKRPLTKINRKSLAGDRGNLNPNLWKLYFKTLGGCTVKNVIHRHVEVIRMLAKSLKRGNRLPFSSLYWTDGHLSFGKDYSEKVPRFQAVHMAFGSQLLSLNVGILDSKRLLSPFGVRSFKSKCIGSS